MRNGSAERLRRTHYEIAIWRWERWHNGRERGKPSDPAATQDNRTIIAW
jgi:hypothetical protein